MTAPVDLDPRPSRSAEPPDPSVPPPGVERIRLFAAAVALVVMTFVQAPGRITPDTKLDLSIDPVRFLAKAWHLWEPLGDSGQLQNQAYGYFLPMGPFYALGHLVGLPAWVVQRLWWSTVLLTAFFGLYRLAGRLGLGTPATRLIAAFGYALSPRMLTELGPVSIEVWPVALAPWVLLPLVAVPAGRHWRAAARSGLAVALAGGVNAVATGAMLPLPLWWLVTRSRSPARRSLLGAWLACVLAAITWWLVPLLVLGRYSPPFLDWIENAQATTSRASLGSALRGTTQWVAWLRLPDPIWPAGWAVVASPAVALLSWLLIGLAVSGLLRRSTPHRAFLVGGVLGGLLLLTLGHVGPVTAPWAPAIQQLLDGAGAALRNTHKFDVILRLPLCLALAHALAVIRVPAVKGLPWTRPGLTFAAICAVFGVAAPGLGGQLPAAGSFTAVPGYWQQAADWLEANDDGGRTLVLPGSTFASHIWGDPHDEPIQALATTPWAIRSAVPLSSAGNIRVLNAVEQQVATGRGSPGLAEFLSRAGITRLLVRADLVRQPAVGATPRVLTVRAALSASPGLRPEQQFGPVLGGDSSPRQAWDAGMDIPVPALEIWSVRPRTGPTPAAAHVYPAGSLLRVSGTPESLLPLAGSGALDGRPVVLAGDPDATAAPADLPWSLTDTPGRREATFARVRQVYGPVLAADEPYRARRVQHDWLPFDRPLVTAVPDGVGRIRASSYATDLQDVWRAFDGDPTTSWVSSQYSVGQYVELSWPQQVAVPARLQVSFGAGARVAALEVRTDAGSRLTELPAEPPPGPATIAVPSGATGRLRLTVTAVWPGQALNRVAISELELPGLRPRRPLVVPTPAGPARGGPPDLISLQTGGDAADGCAFLADRSWCVPALATPGTIGGLDRFVGLPGRGGADYAVTGTARARATVDLERLLRPAGVPVVTASSRRTPEPAQRPQAGFDDDPGTAWVAADDDEHPRLQLSWTGRRTLSSLRWFVAPGSYVSRPDRLTVAVDDRSQTVTLDPDGSVRFRPMTGSRLQLTVESVRALPNRDPDLGLQTALPVGLSELIAPALDDLRRGLPADRRIALGCGRGPTLTVGTREVRTRVTATAGQLLRRQPVQLVPCAGTVPLRPGLNRLRWDQNALLAPETLQLQLASGANRPSAAVSQGVPAALSALDPEHRRVRVPAAATQQLLVVHENANPGWRATLAGATLPTVRVDGWQQGWLVPAGGGTVDLRFTPGRTYRLGLLVGLGLLAGLVVVALGRSPFRQPAGLRRAPAQLMPEAAAGPRYGLLGVGSLLAIAGPWAVLPLVGAFWLVRRRPGGVTGVAVAVSSVAAVLSALSAGADDTGLPAGAGAVCGLLLLALLVAHLDLDASTRSVSDALAASARWAGRRGTGEATSRPTTERASTASTATAEPALDTPDPGRLPEPAPEDSDSLAARRIPVGEVGGESSSGGPGR